MPSTSISSLSFEKISHITLLQTFAVLCVIIGHAAPLLSQNGINFS